MTQMILNIEDARLVPSLQQILSAIKGVTIDKLDTRDAAVKSKKKADPTLLTKEEFFESLKRGEEEYRQGKTHRINSVEELNSFLNSL